MAKITWSYNGINGPEEWAKLYALENSGKRQSPIDLKMEIVEVVGKDSKLSTLTFKYPSEMVDLQLTNGGSSWKVDIPLAYSDYTSLTGGPLKDDVYKLAQFHCHWGKDCTCGSEHTVDGKYYAAELHFVHWNSSRYANFEEAMKQPNGLAVIGVFLDVVDPPTTKNSQGVLNVINQNSNENANPNAKAVIEPVEINEEIQKLSNLMEQVQFKGQTVPIDQPLSITQLMPKNPSYFTYEGSLTTPPLYESVTWIVLKTPIQAFDEQIAKFRLLHTHGIDEIPDSGPNRLLENYRPLQPLNERTVNLCEL